MCCIRDAQHTLCICMYIYVTNRIESNGKESPQNPTDTPSASVVHAKYFCNLTALLGYAWHPGGKEPQYGGGQPGQSDRAGSTGDPELCQEPYYRVANALFGWQGGRENTLPVEPIGGVFGIFTAAWSSACLAGHLTYKFVHMYCMYVGMLTYVDLFFTILYKSLWVWGFCLFVYLMIFRQTTVPTVPYRRTRTRPSIPAPGTARDYHLFWSLCFFLLGIFIALSRVGFNNTYVISRDS